VKRVRPTVCLLLPVLAVLLWSGSFLSANAQTIPPETLGEPGRIGEKSQASEAGRIGKTDRASETACLGEIPGQPIHSTLVPSPGVPSISPAGAVLLPADALSSSSSAAASAAVHPEPPAIGGAVRFGPNTDYPPELSGPLSVVGSVSHPVILPASSSPGVASGPPHLYMPALGSSVCCPAEIKQQFSGADGDPFQIRTPVEWHVVFTKIVGLFPPGVPFFRLGKMINFFSVDPSLDPNQCWGPCKEAVFADFHASPSAHLAPEPSMPTITLPTMQTLLESGVPLTLLDAREHSAGLTEKLPQALLMRLPLTADEAARQLPDKQRMIIVYGATPADPSGKELAQVLRSFGYATVIEFRDGLSAWKKAGLPLEAVAAIETVEPVQEGNR
jgi:rhodanese-related sulfurtransferase